MSFLAPDADRQAKLRGAETGPSGRTEPSVSGPARVLLDGLTEPAVLLSLDGLIVDCNRAVLDASGVERDKIAGRLLWEALPLSTASPAPLELRDVFARAAQGPVQLEVELEPSLRQDSEDDGSGATRFEFRFRPMAGEDGRAAFLVVEGREIGAEKRREQETARQLAAVQSERNQLLDLLARTPAAIGLLSGAEHRWSFINDEYVRMTGRSSPADFLGKRFDESLPEMQTQPFETLLDQVYRTGKPSFGREIKVQLNRTASGQPGEGYFDYLYQPTRNAEGAIDGIFIYAIEVTDKVESRHAIEEHSERLRLAQSAGQIGVWEWDPIKERNNLSPELHRMFATQADDPDRVRNWLARIYPADRAQVELLMWEGHRLGSMEFEYRYLHPDSGLRWLYCKGMRRPGETRMFGIVQDVTVRKAAEQDSQRLAAIITSSDDAIVSKDLKGIVTSWNAGAERIFGYTPEEMIGKSITKIIPPELYDDETRILSTIARGERIEHFETVRMKKNGEPVDISLTISPVRDAVGKIIGAAKIARDITQQRLAERALRTSERLASVGRLAATVAHEINNPLEAVTNLIFLAQNANSLEVAQEYLDMSQEELKRISHLTRQTLGFYRETKGATKMRLGEQVESLLSVFAPRMRNKSIRLFKEINDDVEICAVPGEIRQVIANLISNSIDAIHCGGQIRVRVSHSIQTKDTTRPGVRLSVADTGHGIPSEIRPQLFEPFFTTKRDVGTGLGLWICKSIVEAHQGSIQVRSSTLSGRSGTVFTIFLPVNCGERCTPGNLLPSQRNLDVGEITRDAA